MTTTNQYMSLNDAKVLASENGITVSSVKKSVVGTKVDYWGNERTITRQEIMVGNAMVEYQSNWGGNSCWKFGEFTGKVGDMVYKAVLSQK